MHITTIIYENFRRYWHDQKSLKVNTASGTTLGPIGITSLELNIDDQISVHNFIICTKLKQALFLGHNVAQRYRIGIDWDIYGPLFLRHEGKKIATSMKMTNPGQCMIAFLETPSDKPQDTDQELFLMANHTATRHTTTFQ